MAKLLERIKSMFHERRRVDATVCVDRRHTKPTLKDADAHLHEAIDKLEQTARFRRDDFYRNIERK